MLDAQGDAETMALCSTCASTVPAWFVHRDGAVYLRKCCPIHGTHEDLLEEDAAWWLRRTEYDRPPTKPVPQTERRLGCPHDCGLCPDHSQHTCIGLLEVTGKCDLACPVCYADAGSGDLLSLAQVEVILDAFQEAEGGKAQILQVSGGEPTTHPRILDILRLARAKRIRYVMLNTNGLRIAEDPEFARALAEFKGGFEVYLQFDGVSAGANEPLRGRDLVDVKRRALENLAANGVPSTLVSTILLGVNDQEIGRIVLFALKTPGVRGVNFQPLAFFGRMDGVSPAGRITRTGVLRRLEEQTSGMIRTDDFLPLPCNVDSAAITLLYRHGEEFVPIPRKADVRGYLSLLDNTLAFYAEDVLQNAARALLCADRSCDCMRFLKDVVPFIPIAVKGRLARDKPAFTTDNFFRITVTAFLDRFSFEAGAMRRECVHVLTPDLRRVPFSSWNLVHRGRMTDADRTGCDSPLASGPAAVRG
jgi:7,8-dihydro-6-hydroxymethylpterin dimethyltransferase